MKAISVPLACVLALGGSACVACAHLIGDDSHDGTAPHYDFSIAPPQAVQLRGSQLRGDVILMAQAQRPLQPVAVNALPAMAAPFQAFAPKVKVRADGQFLYVESDGMPAHNMMVGITSWQQQVPLPQAYAGNNAWRIPLSPVPSKNPVSIKGRFLRGAVAIAVNGIPIFNPQNNRGEVSQEIGELDQWGGHCGRADDYHYHAAPLHLQGVVGRGQPIACALDGYPIYGLAEPDGSTPSKLDSFNGHETTALGYHYHGSTKYPYINGGFHGEVVERDGQVDPQPRAQPVRQDLPPLRGARITGFTAKDKSYSLKYDVSGETRYVNYVLNDKGSVKFDFVDGRGQVRSETFTPRPGGGGDRPPGEPKGKGGQRKGPGKGDRPPPPPDRGEARPSGGAGGAVAMASYTPKRTGNFALLSSAVASGGALPVEFTGDGASVTPPLEWVGAPPGTKSFAVIMHHVPGPGETKWYWTLYNIPADVRSLSKNAQGVGTLGNNSVNGRAGYAPPHSKGPGAKTYILTAYALSAPVQISAPPSQVNRDVLLAAMKDLILDSAELKVVYDRTAVTGGQKQGGRKP
ncbi:MAG: YHYH protein [Limisphaerales bacterium]